ncbi:Frataxin CyaY, facilitates iron supply for heme A synthesis or Fe-S cluster assembly [Labilithrix luteola]|uniref:Iron-sulfur cluster assembly protein CyaY n=1 Tax=Labilithrix luteola TaxID=1391654 RepID=A0A0K1Q0E1_9BACT|nr:iron donor protein CyaY [Labilithrix luteola]AKU99202.1 Frataxin CyaY, facilitates iron supply for heme A synthesis or Fe-S cluster assembly [Labilithrix luteola]
MDDKRYHEVADAALRRIENMLEDVDAEDVDVERSGDVVTLTFKSGKKAVVNTQRPTRQIWLAANARAWHFDFDEATSRWLDDKGQSVELLSKVAEIVKESSGLDVAVK